MGTHQQASSSSPALGCGAWAALACGVQLVGWPAYAQAAAAKSPNNSCSPKQVVIVDPQAGWHCSIALTTSNALVVRVDQRDIDVVLSLQDTSGRQVLAVDSPTKRASAEVLLAGPRLSGTYTLLVRTNPGVTSAQRASLTLERIEGPGLLAGLGEMTRASAPDEQQTPESGKKRIAQLQSALAALQSAGAKEWQAEVSLRVAATYFWIVNDWSSAASNASLAMDAFGQLDDAVLQAQAAVIRGASLIEIASAMQPSSGTDPAAARSKSPLEQSIDLLDSAALALKTAGLRYGQAQALNFAGVGLFNAGSYRAARSRYDQAAAIFRALGDAASAALPLQNIAHIDYDRGDYVTATTTFKSLLEVLDPVAEAGQYATVLINLGTTQYVVGQFEAALRSLTTALEMCESNGFAAEQARSLHGLGMVYLVIGDRERAQVFLERALELRRPLSAQDPRGLQASLLRVGDVRRERGDTRGALSLHTQALQAALSTSQKARASYAIGRDHEESGTLAAATQAYKNGFELDLPQDFPVHVTLMGAYGAVRLRNGETSARALVERAAQLHEAHGDVDLAAENYIALAEADRQQQALEAALRNVQKALSLYESQRLGAVNPDLRAVYVANRADAAELLGEIYMTLRDRAASLAEKQRLADTALLAVETSRQRAIEDFRNLAGGTPGQSATDLPALDAALAAKRHRIATLLDQQSPRTDMIAALRKDIGLLRTQIDIEQTRQPGRTAVLRIAHSVGEIQKTLRPRETTLVYQLGARQSQLWAVSRDSVSIARLAGRAQIERAAHDLYSMWTNPAAPVDAVRELAASRTILGDSARWLRGGDTVVVVADGILRSLPFGALRVDTASGARQRIMDTHEVLFRSTLSSASSTQARDDRAASGNRILLVGDPTAPSRSATQAAALADPWALPPLPGSRREIQSIAAIAAGWRSDVLLGAEATKPALLSMPLDAFRAIHFATHARLDMQDPQLSSIALSSRDTSPAASSAMLTVREIVGFRLNAETVVLSACEASLGKSYRGQLSFGLSEAFLLAGAHNVLGSLWRVSDDAAQEYMKHFYQAYVGKDEAPSTSARAAALATSRNPTFTHPYFWAAFAVTQR